MAERVGDTNGNGLVALSPFVPQEKEEGGGKGAGSKPTLSSLAAPTSTAPAAKPGVFPSLSQAEIRDLQIMFQAFDKNQDGRLSSDELHGWMRRLGLRLSRESLLRIINSPDGSVNFAQFLSLNQSLQEEKEAANNDDNDNGREAEEEGKSGTKDEEEQEGEGEEKQNGNQKKKKSGPEKEKKSDMAQAFALFDKNGDGLISPNELGQTLNDLGLLERGKVYHWDSLVRRVDEDGDGRVNLSEFQTMMTKK